MAVSVVANAVASERNERTLFEHLEIGHLERLQIVGFEADIGVFRLCIPVVLCRQRDTASVCQEHSVFLHGARYYLSRRLQLRNVIVGLETKVSPIGRRKRRTAGTTGVG